MTAPVAEACREVRQQMRILEGDFATSVVSIASHLRLVMESCIRAVTDKHIQDAFRDLTICAGQSSLDQS
jgi:hypothetical protein